MGCPLGFGVTEAKVGFAVGAQVIWDTVINSIPASVNVVNILSN